MKQIIRRVIDRKGKVVVADYPEPHLGSHQVLVQNHYSLISTGTEMSTLSKTPAELVRQTLADPWMRNAVKNTVLSAGPFGTARRVWQEMITAREIGYSGAGRVLEVGSAVEGFKIGDAVAYAATGHAEIVAPAVNHVVPVPAGVDLRHASFVTVGGIAIQALRRAELQFGEVVAVVGLGLVGQLCARIAKAAGCVVIGIDVDPARNALAAANGADLVIHPGEQDLVRRIEDFTAKNGVDATLVCASSKSSEVINSSMEITRRQGRVVLVGYVKLDIHPKNFLHREIDLRYSRAYGPGSYHRAYEKGRVDYPFGYVRWTEKRNLSELVRLIDSAAIDLESLIGGSFKVEDVQDAFTAISEGSLPGVAALIDYEADRAPDRRRTLMVRPRAKKNGTLGVSVIGCGNHVLAVHLPNLAAAPGVEVRGLVSATGKNAAMVAKSLDATLITTDIAAVASDPDTDALMICSSHAEHYEHIERCLESGKALFVEKPLVTELRDFKKLLAKMSDQPVLLTLGLNRRYAPLIATLREQLPGPVDCVNYLVTPPKIPLDHWTLDEVDGGGRLLAEAEHFVDLCHLLIDREPIAVSARALGQAPENLRQLCNFAVTIHYEGAVANIVFDESGGAFHPREQLTVLAKGQVAVLEDFKKLTLHGPKKKKTHGGLKQDMGHQEQLKQFLLAVRGESNQLLAWPDVVRASSCVFAAEESLLRGGAMVDVADFLHQLRTADADEESGEGEP